ncbi:hypothetical protein SG34_015290 [Thalassomonas viridans]|uniref:Type III secretion protein n=1 Tax=Thalassomonas viridans TaxID=137584 RepID=A0AAE9YXN0_9GAMM|nr:hypothetical protein [Thalassomonas viridans]WDE02808.1 hypothetical protein SG34_015290 [Thalassomonas viridans]
MKADLLSLDVGLASVERFHAEQEMDLFPQDNSFSSLGEIPKVHLEDVFGLSNVDHELLASLKPGNINSELDSPGGHMRAMEETLALLQDQAQRGSLLDGPTLARATELVQENIENSRLLMSYRLLLVKV